MTVEERLNRIEHLSAGWLEERKRDHEEYIRRWRDTQENADATWKAIERHAREWRAEAADTRAAMQTSLEARDRREEARSKQVDERIDKLVSAIGELITALRPVSPSGGNE